MDRLMIFMSVLALCFLQGNAGPNTAKFYTDLVFSSCNSINLCNNSSTESRFSPFVSHKLPDGTMLELCLEPAGVLSCGSSVTPEGSSYGGLEVLEVERKLTGNGAHRELSSSLLVQLEKRKTCRVIVAERLSSGVFADTFELEGLVARGAYENAVIYGDHNLELPALQSFESMVVLQTSLASESEHPLQAKISLPLHARYPPLSLESHATVNLKFPYILFQCFHEGRDASAANSSALTMNGEARTWALLTGRDSPPFFDQIELQWLVPTGNPLHFESVAAITACTSLFGVVILWVVSKHSYDSKIRKNDSNKAT